MRKDIEGYEGHYVIDGLRIISVKFGKEKELKQCKDKYGYLYVGLFKDGKGKNYKVHRLIAKAYIPNADNKPYINHKNGIRDDNRIENLEWCNQSENIKHSFDTGLQPKGEKHHSAKHPDSVIHRIFEMKSQRYLQKEIAKEVGYSEQHISDILNGKQRKL